MNFNLLIHQKKTQNNTIMNFTNKEIMNLKLKPPGTGDSDETILKSQKKIIKLDKTSILNTTQSSFLPKNTQTSDAKVLTLVKKQFINNIKSNTPVPANNITNTIFNSNKVINSTGNPINNNSGGKPILVIKQISDMTSSLSASKPENSRKNLTQTATVTTTPPVKKPKPKNSGHIKTLLSQSEQNIPLKQHIPPAIFTIAKKAPAIKILKTQPIVAKPLPPPVPILVDESSLIELSVQEVTVQSTDPEPISEPEPVKVTEEVNIPEYQEPFISRDPSPISKF